MGEILHNISEKDYRALPAESFSSLKYLLKGPKYFFGMKKTPFKGNTATDFGTAIHHLLQGHKDYVGFMNRTNKEKFAEFEWEFMLNTKQEGVILQQAYKDKFEAIEKVFEAEPKIVDFVKQFEYEIAFSSEFEGCTFKGKVDGLKKEQGKNFPIFKTLEIKTYGQGAGLEDFRRIAYQRDYDMQAYMYKVMAKSDRHYFLAISTSEPYTIGVYPASDAFLESGKRKFEIALANYKKYVVNGEPYEQDFEEL